MRLLIRLNSRTSANSPILVTCDAFNLAGSGGFNRRRLLPSVSVSTPTERRGYNFSSSRLVATSLCRGAVVPGVPASTNKTYYDPYCHTL
jgi:hypothetical protein